MDEARLLGMDRRRALASECHELRTQLKDWEKSFAENNSGQKPGKENIKKNPEIAAKYKTYNRTRDILEGKQGFEPSHLRPKSVHEHKSTSSLKPAQLSQPKTPNKALSQKVHLPPSHSHPNALDPYDPPSSVSPHSYVFKNAIGPTPQRDGKILGLFDFLSTSGSTPSTRKRKAGCLKEKQSEVSVAQTPCRKSAKRRTDLLYDGHSPETRRHSRTPASDGKKFLLSQFFATPTTMRYSTITEDPVEKVEKTDVNQTPLHAHVLAGQSQDEKRSQREEGLETTPAFLRRTTSFNQRLLNASGSNSQISNINTHGAFMHSSDVRKGPSMRPFKGRPLSEILRGLRQMEDNDNEDEMDALREIEENAMNILSGDRQSAVDHSAVGELSARVWKKKGQKRTTRRVMMRPANTRTRAKNSDLNEGDTSAVEDEVATMDEVDAPAPVPRTVPQHAKSDTELQTLSQDSDYEEKEDSSDLPATVNENNFLESDFDVDEVTPTFLPKKPKALSKSATRSAKAPKETPDHGAHKKESKKKGINPNAQSHMNFRSLKLRNRNSKTNGRGKFGRRKR